jgi:hypothetical protein
VGQDLQTEGNGREKERGRWEDEQDKAITVL